MTHFHELNVTVKAATALEQLLGTMKNGTHAKKAPYKDRVSPVKVEALKENIQTWLERRGSRGSRNYGHFVTNEIVTPTPADLLRRAREIDVEQYSIEVGQLIDETMTDFFDPDEERPQGDLFDTDDGSESSESDLDGEDPLVNLLMANRNDSED